MPIKERKIDDMPIKQLYCCDFCSNETVAPNENWHRLAPAKPQAQGQMQPAAQILCNVCKDHLVCQVLGATGG